MPLVPPNQNDGPYHNSGLFASAGAGRTDIHDRQVPAGGYVVPADVVSALAEGNTLGGSAVLDKMMGIQKGQQQPAQATVGARPLMQSKGGASGKNAHVGKPTPVVVAGGEYYIPPDAIMNKFGDLQRGHKILDAFVKNIRSKNIQTLKKLPGPKR